MLPPSVEDSCLSHASLCTATSWVWEWHKSHLHLLSQAIWFDSYWKNPGSQKPDQGMWRKRRKRSRRKEEGETVAGEEERIPRAIGTVRGGRIQPVCKLFRKSQPLGGMEQLLFWAEEILVACGVLTELRPTPHLSLESLCFSFHQKSWKSTHLVHFSVLGTLHFVSSGIFFFLSVHDNFVLWYL